MTAHKVSLSLDADLLAEAKDLAGPRGLSSLVNDALRVHLQQVRVSRLLDEMDDEFGPVPPEVAEEVAREWPAQALAAPASIVLTSDPDDLGPLLAGSPQVTVVRV